MTYPKLFGKTATSFSSEGLGRLSDCLSCIVHEKLNGEFELEMDYPTTGIHYAELENDMLIVCDAARDLQGQAFRIYKITKPLNGRVTVNAAHISYDLNYIPVQPFSATGFSATATALVTNSMESNPFTLTTNDITNTDTIFTLNLPKSFRACLGGSQGSILQYFGGSSGVELKFDNYTVYADLHRGSDKGYQLRYGKNITDLKQEADDEDTITGCVPIWHDQDNATVYVGNIQYNAYQNNYPFNRTVVYDTTQLFQTAPDSTTLDQAGYDFINQKDQGLPQTSVKVSFVDLYGTSSYSQVQPLEEVCMGDTVTVYYSPLDVYMQSEVIETKWNVLKDRYDSITVGSRKSSLADTLHGMTTDINTNTNDLVSMTLRIDYESGLLQSTIGTVTAIGNTVDEHTTQITQNSNDITIMTSQITTIEGVTNNVNSWFTFGSSLTIGNSESDIQAVLDNDSLDFTDGTNRLAWVDATDGMGATQLSLGDATSPQKRWLIRPSADANHLFFLRRT